MDPAKNTKMSGCREGRERRIFRPQKCCCCCCRPLIAQPINIWVKKKEKWNDAALFPSLVSIDSGNRKKRRETRVDVNAICWWNPRKTLDSSAQVNCAAQLLA